MQDRGNLSCRSCHPENFPGDSRGPALLAALLAGAYLRSSTPGRSRSRRARGPAVERPERAKFDVAGKVRRLRKGVPR